MVSSIFRLFSLAQIEAFKGKKMPEWITTHPEIESKKRISKIFKHFGLKNFREQIDPSTISVDNTALNTAATRLNYAVKTSLSEFMTDLITHSTEVTDEAKKLAFTIKILREVITTQSFVEDPSGKLKYILFGDVLSPDGKIAFRKGESVFKAYGKLDRQIRSEFPGIPTRPPIDQWREFKEFSRLNVPISKLEIVFSADDEGAYDISTMSMRGIESCQSWDGSHRKCLIGSILSKFVGIIYLTSGSDFEGRGEKMIKRCIVRFGVNIKTKKPVLILDKMYYSHDSLVSDLFIDALKKRTNLPVLDYSSLDSGDDVSLEDISLPYEEQMEKLQEFEYPYSDLGLEPVVKEKKYTTKKEDKHIVKSDLVSYLILMISDFVPLIKYSDLFDRSDIASNSVYNLYDMMAESFNWQPDINIVTDMMIRTGTPIELAKKRLLTLIIRNLKKVAAQNKDNILRRYSFEHNYPSANMEQLSKIYDKIIDFLEYSLKLELKRFK